MGKIGVDEHEHVRSRPQHRRTRAHEASEQKDEALNEWDTQTADIQKKARPMIQELMKTDDM